MNHQCKKCGKEFSHLGNYRRHINRKIPCDKKTQYSCDRCQKVFSNKTKYTKHVNRKYPCQSINEILLENIELKYENKVLKLENENQQLRSMIQCSNTITTNYHNTINNTMNSHNTINTTNNNITNNITNNTSLIVNEYGKEDLSYIPQSMIKGFILSGPQGEVNFFEHIHFNKDHLENWNLELRDLSRDKIGVVTGHDNGKKVYRFITKGELVKDHQELTYDYYKADMVRRSNKGEEVSKPEITNLHELGAPSSEHRKQTCKGLIEVMQRHVHTKKKSIKG